MHEGDCLADGIAHWSTYGQTNSCANPRTHGRPDSRSYCDAHRCTDAIAHCNSYDRTHLRAKLGTFCGTDCKSHSRAHGTAHRRADHCSYICTNSAPLR
jgi:hypothetical protein